MKKYKISVNLILGLLVGIEVVIFLLSQINLFVSYLGFKDIQYSVTGINVIGWTIASLVFLFIVKAFLSIKNQRLFLYFILSIVTAAIATLLIWYCITIVFAYGFVNDELLTFLNSDIGGLVAINISYLVLAGIIFLFIVFFSLMINRKVKYLQYISREVKRIEVEGFGNVMEVRGDDELTDLSKGINSMSVTLKEKLEKEKIIEQNKNELISNVSHDLRTPLTSVMGYVALLKQNGFQDKDKFDEYLEVVERRMDGLNTLINELFEYTKLASSEFKLELVKTDFLSVIKHLVNEYRILYEKNGLELECHFQMEQCVIEIDVNKMIRVVQNLLDNAKKYAKRQSKVVINIYEESNHLYIEIKNELEDNQKLEVDRLFDRFYKGDKARSESDSSGLGLSIVKRIIELHDGEMNVDVNENTIKFQLVLKK